MDGFGLFCPAKNKARKHPKNKTVTSGLIRTANAKTTPRNKAPKTQEKTLVFSPNLKAFNQIKKQRYGIKKLNIFSVICSGRYCA